MTTQLKAYRATLKRQFKRRHDKGIGVSARMKWANIFTDLYERRNPKYNGAWDAGYRPCGKWLRRRLLAAQWFRENEFLIPQLA